MEAASECFSMAAVRTLPMEGCHRQTEGTEVLVTAREAAAKDFMAQAE